LELDSTSLWLEPGPGQYHGLCLAVHQHGHASCVKVVFERDERQTRIVVPDDVCSFDPAPSSDGDHLGLAFMGERMSEIGGCLTVHSRLGAETQLVFLVPIRDERK
jgi:signal transduction histidine kinase